MGKSLYITEKPSVAQEFAKVLNPKMGRRKGYLEGADQIITWCVGHLVTMSYPDVYDPRLKRWSLDTLPFLPNEFKYEVIPSAAEQFDTVKKLLLRGDVDTIYVCTDAGREGEYIYRLVEQMVGVQGKKRLRVWIDSQTEEEIHRGIREARDLSDYDNLASAAYLRAKEDYLIGINFSRLLTLKYGSVIGRLLHKNRTVLSVGRVMTCVLGMTVRREREIREFVRTPFYRVLAEADLGTKTTEMEWRAVEGSHFRGNPRLYKENGWREKKDAESLTARLKGEEEGPWKAVVVKRAGKKEKKWPPLLFNLAELQNTCSRSMKQSPDETLKIVQDLYERKLVTYPRTDARVLSSAAAKEIEQNIRGLAAIPGVRAFSEEILQKGLHTKIAQTRYTNDRQITDHYAIIPTGKGIRALSGLSPKHRLVYEKIVRRFLSIFYPPAEYEKTTLEVERDGEHFFASFKALIDPGFMKVSGEGKSRNAKGGEDPRDDPQFRQSLRSLRKGIPLMIRDFTIREGETSPPKRYTSGSMILAMENAGQLIEDEDLRAQIRGSGIGTSATRAEIIRKLVTNRSLTLNEKTQVLAPTLEGELIYEAVSVSIRSLLNPDLTASWEKGLTQVAEGTITEEVYMEKLKSYIVRRTEAVLRRENAALLQQSYKKIVKYYDGGKK